MINRRTTVCAWCSEEFTWLENTDLELHDRVFCSKACRRGASKSRRTLETSEHQGEDVQLLTCTRCGVPFAWVRQEDWEAPPMYHSVSCQNRASLARKKARERELAKTPQVDPAPLSLGSQARAPRRLLLQDQHCPTCGKVASPTEEVAKMTKAAIEQRSGHTNEVRYYECREGFWHWTSQNASRAAYRGSNR